MADIFSDVNGQEGTLWETTDTSWPLRDKNGKIYNTKVIANANGSFDVYSKGTGSFGGDQLIFQYSPLSATGTGRVSFEQGIFKNDTSAYDSFFKSGGNGTYFTKQVKTEFYQTVPPNTARRLATLPGYKSISNTTQPRAPKVDPAAAEAVRDATGVDQTGVNPTDTEIKDALKNLEPITIEVGTAIARDSYGKYYYPADLETNGQDRIVFKMFKYAPATLNPTLGQRTITRNISQQLTGSVTLPITGGISDSNSVDWSGATINPVQAMGAAASLKLMNTKDIEQFGEVGGQILSTALNELTKNKTYGKAFKVYLAQEAVGIQNLLSRASGAILNPNMELLFNGPSLRSFNYQFKMSPRDVKEAKQVRSIIRFFKQGMSVKTTEENVFLKAPNVFSIEYLTQSPNGGFINHPSINIIKKCALISCDVNYTPDGTYMTYDDNDRTMTSYELTLRFGELEPIYDEDYNIDGNEDLLIGY